MGTSELIDNTGRTIPNKRPGLRGRVFVVVCFVALATFFSCKHGSVEMPVNSMRRFDGLCQKGSKSLEHVVDFDWNDIYPSEKLNWVNCFEKFQCARLEVPLDYAKPHEEKAAIALLKYPSKYAPSDPRWRGPILYNPGGPGGSGVQAIQKLGEQVSKVIGDDYDHIGFDPRGVGETTPPLNVFETPAERTIWEAQVPKFIKATNGEEDIARWMAYADVYGNLAKERSFTSSHVSTALVARDMLQITKAHGREKLLYWGFSYGTVLGATFASMFPDNIDRMIIDGVDDSYDYYTGLWSTNLVDTDKAFRNTIVACLASPKCPFYAPNSTAEELLGRITGIIDGLRDRPLPTISLSPEGTYNYGLLDRDVARTALFQAIYKPREMMLPLFSALADVEKGEGKALLDISGKKDSLFRCSCGGKKESYQIKLEMTTAISCSDATVVAPDIEELRALHGKIRNSSEFAELWLASLMCSGWKVRPVERFEGKIEGNTSHPILMISTTADPVTPLEAAHRMSRHFPGSVVLAQNSTGHCSISSPSSCTAKYVREYFREGTLPAHGMLCETDYPMFSDEPIDMSILSAEEQAFRENVKVLSDSYEVPKLGIF